MAVTSISGAVGAAAIWGYLGAMLLRPHLESLGQTPPVPAVVAMLAALTALFLYGPAIAIAIRARGVPEGGMHHATTSLAFKLGTAFGCGFIALLFLLFLNVGQAALRGWIPQGGLLRSLTGAVLTEAPMAMLAAVQGFFVLAYLDLDPTSAQLRVKRWGVILLNVVFMTVIAVVATELIVAAYRTIGFWTTSGLIREATWADYALRVPTAALVGLIIGLAITSTLSNRFRAPASPAEAVEVAA